ncbi:MAG: metallophosphoesterase [Opitutales bacterium]|nr:metallophosphoesterase [Opitutales bacterium]
MRIIHISDFHACEPWFDWASSVLQGFDLCVYSGDWLAFGRADFWQQIGWVSNWIRNCPIPLITCSGNHDWYSPEWGRGGNGEWLHRLNKSGRVWVDHDTFPIGEFHGVVCAWQHEPCLPLPENGPLMLVSHAPPSQTRLSSSDGRDYGDDWIHEASQRVCPGSLLLCGHVHAPLGHVQQIGNFLCINAGRGSEGRIVPNHAIIDTESHSVEIHADDAVKRIVW